METCPASSPGASRKGDYDPLALNTTMYCRRMRVVKDTVYVSFLSASVLP